MSALSALISIVQLLVGVYSKVCKKAVEGAVWLKLIVFVRLDSRHDAMAILTPQLQDFRIHLELLHEYFLLGEDLRFLGGLVPL